MLKTKALDDKYFKIYQKLFNHSLLNYKLVNSYLLYNYVLKKDDDSVCNTKINTIYKDSPINLKVSIKQQKLKGASNINKSFNYQYIILNNIYNDKLYSKTPKLIITYLSSIIYGINEFTNINNLDLLMTYDHKIKDKEQLTNRINKINQTEIFHNKYIGIDKNAYLEYLTNPLITKYKIISLHMGYISGLSLSASYSQILNLNLLIQYLTLAFSNLEKDGTLLLFWTIINIHVPSIQKILTLLSHTFEHIQVITDDINQNFFQGIPEYYIKCTGYKANLTEELLNALLDVSLQTIDYSYDICDILDYYENYSKQNPNQCLFYKYFPTDDDKFPDAGIQSRKTSSKSKSLKNSFRISQLLKASKYSSKTKKSTMQTKKHSTKTPKDIKEIKYIEDFDLPGFLLMLEDPETQYKTMLLSNKLESIFIECFDKINNMIVNQTEINDHGILQVKPYAITQRKVNDIKRFVNMLETNNIAYNKHILTIIKEQETELINSFYNLDNTINATLIKYNDKHSKGLIRNAFSNFRLCSGYTIDIVLNYFQSINLAYRVKENLLDSLGLDRAPRIVQSAFEDFTRGLKSYITARYASKLPHREVSNAFTKMWECLTIFDNLIPRGAKTNKFRVMHICEAPGQMILACKYFTQQKRKNITDYDWRANSLNPFNKALQQDYQNKIFGDTYGLIKGNPGKWLWGADNTGDITAVKNIKWFRDYIRNKYLKDDEKLDLIVGDGGLNTGEDPLLLQKLDLAQVIAVLACSGKGGSCVIKHFTPYIKRHTDTYNAIGFFIGFLYMYYVAFDEVSLFKPYTSNPDSGEFYVIGQGFNGIDDSELERLYKMLDKFELNDALIPAELIPETFVSQINVFLEKMSDLNTMSIEKQNLLLTCYKNGKDGNDGKNQKVGKYLKCDKFMDEDNLQTILVPRYNAWIKKYSFI
jgi:hypothetical protein